MFAAATRAPTSPTRLEWKEMYPKIYVDHVLQNPLPGSLVAQTASTFLNDRLVRRLQARNLLPNGRCTSSDHPVCCQVGTYEVCVGTTKEWTDEISGEVVDRAPGCD
jgi:hypothetical protein